MSERRDAGEVGELDLRLREFQRTQFAHRREHLRRERLFQEERETPADLLPHKQIHFSSIRLQKRKQSHPRLQHMYNSLSISRISRKYLTAKKKKKSLYRARVPADLQMAQLHEDREVGHVELRLRRADGERRDLRQQAHARQGVPVEAVILRLRTLREQYHAKRFATER